MKKDVIITFDYEVFLGSQTGSIENSVIKPTQHVLEILKKNNAKAIFFVDATWLLFLRENFPLDFNLVSEQLKSIIKVGSSVELHLHPQWLDALKNGSLIEFKSFDNFRLHSLGETEILDLFRKSIELLESITSRKIQCFRAGGFCIEPFTQIKSAFELFEIKYDFSVAPGMLLTGGNVYDFDFSGAPILTKYHFQNNVNIIDSFGQFIEIPLSTYQNNPIYRLANKLQLMLKKDKIFGDGKGIQQKTYYFFKSLSRRFRFSKALLTMDKTSNAYFKYLIKYHFNKTDLLVIISHPKTLSRQALLNLEYVSRKFNTLNSLDLDDLMFR